MHERGVEISRHRGAPVDTGQPGLRLVRAVVDRAGPWPAATVRARVGGRGGRRRRIGAVARELMVALVRAGVTATCSSADGPRYGSLEVDSNLPDARIALGGPDHNAFTAAVLAAADPATPRSSTGSCTPPARPGCGCRPRRRWPTTGCPARTCAACGRCRCSSRRRTTASHAAVASVVDDLADAEIAVDQQAPSELGEFEQRTVALLNRGVPGFAVDTDGTLHTSLMRSCTGWPSGVWIDPAAPHRPRRLELPAAALDPHVRLRAGLRRRRLAIGRRPGPQRGVLPPAAGRRRKAAAPQADCPAGARCWRSSPQVPSSWPRSRRRATRWHPAAASAVDPTEAVAVRLVETCRRHNRCRDHVRAAQGVLRVARRPARAAAPAEAPRIRGSRPCTATRSPPC